jgi:hypothetical protein
MAGRQGLRGLRICRHVVPGPVSLATLAVPGGRHVLSTAAGVHHLWDPLHLSLPAQLDRRAVDAFNHPRRLRRYGAAQQHSTKGAAGGSVPRFHGSMEHSRAKWLGQWNTVTRASNRRQEIYTRGFPGSDDDARLSPSRYINYPLFRTDAFAATQICARVCRPLVQKP